MQMPAAALDPSALPATVACVRKFAFFSVRPFADDFRYPIDVLGEAGHLCDQFLFTTQSDGHSGKPYAPCREACRELRRIDALSCSSAPIRQEWRKSGRRRQFRAIADAPTEILVPPCNGRHERRNPADPCGSSTWRGRSWELSKFIEQLASESSRWPLWKGLVCSDH